MRQIRRIALMLSILLAIMTTCAASGLAASFSISGFTYNHWYNLQPYNNVRTIYKLKLTADAAFTVHIDRNKTCFVDYYIYRDKECTDVVYKNSCWGGTPTKVDPSMIFLLTKGTYYLLTCVSPNGDGPCPSAKLKLTRRTATYPGNKTRAKAITLAKNKVTRIYQTSARHYNRWFRINVTNKKIVHYYLRGRNSGTIALYDAKGKKVPRNGSFYETKNPIKGTFYIKVTAPTRFINECQGAYGELKWY